MKGKVKAKYTGRVEGLHKRIFKENTVKRNFREKQDNEFRKFQN